MIRNPKSLIPRKKIKSTEETSKEHVRKPYVDNYINEAVSETIGIAKNNSIKQLLDELHPDVVRLFNNSEVKQYRNNSDGLELRFKNGIVAKIISLSNKQKQYILNFGGKEIINTILNNQIPD